MMVLVDERMRHKQRCTPRQPSLCSSAEEGLLLYGSCLIDAQARLMRRGVGCVFTFVHVRSTRH